MTLCDKAPKGWRCSREKDHDGPCAVYQVRGRWGRLMDAVGEALGEAMFGGGR